MRVSQFVFVKLAKFLIYGGDFSVCGLTISTRKQPNVGYTEPLQLLVLVGYHPYESWGGSYICGSLL